MNVFNLLSDLLPFISEMLEMSTCVTVYSILPMTVATLHIFALYFTKGLFFFSFFFETHNLQRKLTYNLQ